MLTTLPGLSSPAPFRIECVPLATVMARVVHLSHRTVCLCMYWPKFSHFFKVALPILLDSLSKTLLRITS